jgi:ribosome-associated toxin RatA of RatAB toxin-antitoxin module
VGTINGSWTVEIAAPLGRVWEAAADVPASPVWQPALQTVETLETDAQGRATLVDTSSNAVVRTTKQQLRFEYDEPTGMSWVQIEGEVKSLEGSWEFVELAVERTRATFALDIDPGRMLGMLLRGPVQGKVKEFLTKGAAEGLKQHVESDDSA